ncbi:glycosyltransferase family 10 domain-containing protein [Falsiroseomonas sp.]|uniref:glycosyltransferase family 10 domain-containing protein n=1 Tax=Falsiroseomonas sp. TaxID=2870721 RepID=UPI0034A3ABA5
MKKVHILEGGDTLPLVRDPLVFKTLEWEITDDRNEADVILGVHARRFTPEVCALRRLNILWTHEPFADSSNRFRVRDPSGLGDLYVFNLYNRNVYFDNFFYFQDRSLHPLNYIRSEADLNVSFDKKKVVTFMTAKRFRTLIDGMEVSLAVRRVDLALEGHAGGRLDVFGRGWPEGVALSESRYANDRSNVKLSILKEYNFNFCPENTQWDYYVSEKFWEAIMGNCLPIYAPNRTLPMVVPDDLFINFNGMKTFDEITAAIDSMSFANFAERMNEMKRIMEYCRSKQFARQSRERRREHFVSVAAVLA